MNRIRLFVIGALVLALAAPLAAQNTSTSQFALARSTVFTARVQYLMMQYTYTVLNEGTTDTTTNPTEQRYGSACHVRRVDYARFVLLNPGAAANAAAILLVSANFSGAVLIGTVTGSAGSEDTTQNDTVLSTVIKNYWNTLAQCAPYAS